MNKEKKEIVLAKESIFQYERVISYFLTIFFYFFYNDDFTFSYCLE